MSHDPLCIWSSPTCSNERVHTEYPDGTNGFRDQRCRECDEYCLCELIAAVRVRTTEDIIGMLSMNTEENMIHDPLCVVRPYMTPLGIAITPFSDSDTCEVCNLIKQVRVQTAEDIIRTK